MRHPQFRAILLILIFILAIATWFGWMSYTQSKTQWIASKVQQAMVSSMESLAPHWPRIEMHSDLVNGMYFTPIINDPARNFELSWHVLKYLNQDVTVPPIKVNLVSLHATYESTDDILTCQAYIEFPLFAGINKTMMVQSNIKIPHYASP